MTSICKICGSSTYQVHDEQFDIIYDRCNECAFIHQDVSSHVTFEQEREEYDLHENSIEDEGYVSFLDKFLKIGVDAFIKEGSALDFGCGPEPVLAELLKRRGFEVKTYDRHYPHDIDALDFKYDLITSTEVFEHFHDPVEEMSKISDLLRSGGQLSVMTSVPPEDESFKKWAYRREQTHISFYTLKSLEVLAQKNGMSIIYHDSKRITVFRKL